MQIEMERFIDWTRMRSPQARTWHDYKCDLQLFASIVRRPNVEDVRFRDVDEFVNFQVNMGYKPSTVNRRLAAVASFYRFLLEEGRQVACPVLSRRHYLKEPQHLPRPVNERDLQKFFNAIHDARDKAMCMLMLTGGLRIGEVSALKMMDIYLGEDPSRMIIRGKGSRERTVYLSSEAERDLKLWLEKRPKTRCEYVFVTYDHKKISTTSINNCVSHIRKRSGVNLTAHMLRHTFADRLLSAGMPITSIQKLMGHRFVETTQIYAVANDKQVEADFYKSSEKLNGWKLLMQAMQVMSLEYDMTTGDGSAPEEQKSIQYKIPARISRLGSELTSQLEAYRRTQVNRWRTERVEENSSNFYSMHTTLWNFFDKQCGITSVTELRSEHVLKYVQHRLEKGYCAKGINIHLSGLRSFLSFLKGDEVSIDPSLENIRRLKETALLPRYMAAAQVLCLKDEIEARILKAKDHIKKYDALLLRAAFFLFWQGGLRVGEVDELKFSDFYISSAKHTRRLFIRDGKWRKGRVVYLTDTALAAIQEYLAVRGVDRLGGYVFVRNGKPLKSGYLSKKLKETGRQVNVQVTAHRLRHTYATQLLNVGCQVTSIQKLLGHTNLNTTMTYARAYDETVMRDYFHAVQVIEAQSGGSWYGVTNTQQQGD
jgi:site-specific recombinase XerD